MTAHDAVPAVAFDNVQFAWPGSTGFGLEVEAFAVARGEKMLLVGPSGSGKTTLLSLLCGIVAADRGTVSVLGHDLGALRSVARDRFRAEHIGIIFQMFNLLPYGSLIDNVVLPLSFAKERRRRVVAEHSVEDEARRLLDRLGLDQSIVMRGAAAKLSVGQQQRVAAARALIGRPKIVVADEPTSALDRNRQQAFLDLLFEEIAAVDATLLMVSHDETLGERFDRVVHLTDVARTGAAQATVT